MRYLKALLQIFGDNHRKKQLLIVRELVQAFNYGIGPLDYINNLMFKKRVLKIESYANNRDVQKLKTQLHTRLPAIDDKQLFQKKAQELGLPTPRVLGLIVGGVFTSHQSPVTSYVSNDLKNCLLNLLSKHQEVFIKRAMVKSGVQS